jgi:hypothetical protein
MNNIKCDHFMVECVENKIVCNNLILRTAKTGQFQGQQFFGCKLYPTCNYLIPLHFEEEYMTEEEKKLATAFELFVHSNLFIDATFGVVYFNLHNPAFLDYLLKSGIVFDSEGVEIGLTGAKIFHALFYHLFLIPKSQIKRYLVNNFPTTYENLYRTSGHRFFGSGIDYTTHTIDETQFIMYKDINTYNR